MAAVICTLIWLASAYPLWRAWHANHRAPLVHALNWAVVTWAAWLSVFLTWVWPIPQNFLVGYLALAMTGCTMVSVLEPRRPGAAPWNLVVLGLLAVMMLPLAEGLVSGGSFHLSWAHRIFLAATIGIGFLNYLPTRLGWGASCLAAGCFIEILTLGPGDPPDAGWQIRIARALVALSIWGAFLARKQNSSPPDKFGVLWAGFKDRFGVVWSQRVREQFNRSAAHRGWPVHLYWQGLRVISGKEIPGPSDQKEILATLQALLTRFGPQDTQTESGPKTGSQASGSN
jgi:hypothetical protein